MFFSLALQSTAAPDTQPTTQSVAQTLHQASEAAQQAARDARSAADLARKAAEQAQGQASPAPNPRTTPIRIFGITLVGMTRDNAIKLLMTVILIAVLIGLSWGLRALSKLAFSRTNSQKVIFWVRQAINLLLLIIFFIGIISIWFSETANLATFMGLVTAGVAFSLQKPISAFAGYIVILRGKTFNVGDRIVMGGVRGDVIELGFYQTTIMEMGEPPPVQDAPPAVWVHARQYTGRVVTVPNSMVFDGPVFNFTRDFPFLWEEMQLPVSYKDDRTRAEKILLEVADRHTVKLQEMSRDAIEEMHRRYFTKDSDIHPTVYFRLTDNWIEMTVRFVCKVDGVRDLKNRMSREIIDALDAAKIGIASSTYDVVGMPPLRVRVENSGSLPA
jgi:small-conductance mechanosensitive channel